MYIPILTFYLCSRDQNGDKSFQRAMENPNRWHSRSLLKSLSLVTWLRYIPRIHACTGIYRCIPGIYMYVQVYTRYIQVYTGYIQVYTKYLGVYMYVIKNYPWWRRYVLKPQREGGGNNVYGDDIRPFLKVHHMAQIMTQNPDMAKDPTHVIVTQITICCAGDWKQRGEKCLHSHGQDPGASHILV